MLGRRALCAALASLVLTHPALACQMARVAQVPITLAQGFALVPIEVGGQTWPFLLDTGAQDLLVTPGAAAAMGLAIDPGKRTPVLTTGEGGGVAQNVLLRGASLGGVGLGGVNLPARSVPAATLPGLEQVVPTPAGILGAPALQDYDVLLDVPSRQLSLYAVQGCAAVPVPFEPPLTAVPMQRVRGVPVLRIEIGGRPVDALLDTGARGTLLSSAAAARLGRPAVGLRVGTDVLPALQPTVTPLQLDAGEALLGMDYLGSRRVWISHATDQLIVQVPRSKPPRPALAP